MMGEEFVTFRKFNNPSLALELTRLLDKNSILYLTDKASSSLDGSFGGGEFLNEYIVKLRQEDFQKADELLLHESVKDIESIDEDYYLFAFSDEELREVVVKKDEWNSFDYLLAQKLLKERGYEISAGQLEQLRNERLNELARPEKNQSASIIAGYFFAFFGGIFGIFVGWYLKTHKKILPNGESVYNYSESDRRHGNRIMYLGIFFLAFWIVVRTFIMPRIAAGSFSH